MNIVTTTKIQEAGAADILTTLKKVDPAFAGSANIGAELNNNSANPGEGNISIRNLPTLVLINGRRVANSALSAATGGAVDI
ncbi:MAG: TonB-dependent receptor plug domain-containing protein, partial [Acidobacteriia bacterium]|nr:TonB-dependent receptor plug domain-containing protein [Terriglobia bacterium]